MTKSSSSPKFDFQRAPLAESQGEIEGKTSFDDEEDKASKTEVSLRHLLDDLSVAVAFRTSSTAHIRVVDDGCGGCSTKACLYVCPANLFILTADQSILFNYEGCFECGACEIACPTYVNWSYPTGGYGVSFKHG
ncbi:MAG: 4Fe-4S ferredoxin [Actinomycetota bacterium]|nr:4Fe-4S ferredoxin [Actinomycetota bacterium]